ncbi:MAG: hypothetical protein HW413_1504 [Thermoleophilia bacterium]|nr:hypothetical protein [Thermoleophilia bacterium]
MNVSVGLIVLVAALVVVVLFLFAWSRSTCER